MTDVQQRAAAKEFAADWQEKGYEKGHSQTFCHSIRAVGKKAPSFPQNARKVGFIQFTLADKIGIITYKPKPLQTKKSVEAHRRAEPCRNRNGI